MSCKNDLDNAVSQIAERGVNGGVPVLTDERDQSANDGRDAAPATGGARQGGISMAPVEMTGTPFPQQRISTQHLRPLPVNPLPSSGGANIQPDEKR